MPSYYKWPAYIGNALLLISGLIICAENSLWGGAAVVALAALNLYLVRKLDVFSSEEVWLAMEIQKARMRQELVDLQARATDQETNAAAPINLPRPSEDR